MHDCIQAYDKLGNDLESAHTKFGAVPLKKLDEAQMALNVLDATKSIFSFMSLDYSYQVWRLCGKRW